MNWTEILQQIFELCIIPLLGILTGYLIKVIKNKTNELNIKAKNILTEKYNNMLSQTVTNCVIATNQTYVDSLKGQDAFNYEAQKEAFNKTYQAVIAILSEEAKEFLKAAYGDLNAYIAAKIESEVNLNKGFDNNFLL